MELPMHEIRFSVIGKGWDLPQFRGDDGGIGPHFPSTGLGVRKTLRFLSRPSISRPSREAQKPVATVQPTAVLAKGAGEGVWGGRETRRKVVGNRSPFNSLLSLLLIVKP